MATMRKYSEELRERAVRLYFESGVRAYSIGIQADGSSDNLILGVTATGNNTAIALNGRTVGSGNEVSGSTISDNGLGVSATSTSDIVVDGNTIVRNARRGVFIQFADEVTVAGNVIGENGFYGIEHGSGSGGSAVGNTITGNGSFGIFVSGGVFTDGFTITRNVIAENGGLGINLLGGKEDANGVTANDAHDRDDGGNDLLNHPEIRAATDDGTATTVEGRVEFPDPQSLTLELFADDAPVPSGFGEGETFVGTATPDAKGRFTATLPAGFAGKWLTATATDSAANTSEFSEAVRVGVPKK